MAQVAHPKTEDSIEVEIIDRESHRGEYLQVEATDDDISLADESGDSPWMNADEVTEVEA